MIDQVSPAALAQWFAQDPAAPAVLVDVREPWERETASVTPDGFTLVAIPMNEIPARIACLCHHGARSQRVAMFLEHQGFEQVANVSGGIDAWSATHDPAVPRY